VPQGSTALSNFLAAGARHIEIKPAFLTINAEMGVFTIKEQVPFKNGAHPDNWYYFQPITISRGFSITHKKAKN
jgi:hypothetical protein